MASFRNLEFLFHVARFARSRPRHGL